MIRAMSNRMDIGVVIFPTDDTIEPARLAKEVEARGFAALWFPEHTHIPVSRQSPWPGGPELPRHYYRTYDPFVALAMAAAVTSTIKLGTGICLVVERDPITLAKEVASVDRLSGGRFQFGIGAGWNLEEMRNHGTDPTTRFALMEERVAAMKVIWANDEAEFHGRHVDFDKLFSWPKPVQSPNPPIYIGGDGPKALDRVVRYGDVWMPIPGRSATPLSERIKELQDKAAAAGRERIPVHIFGAPAKASVIENFRDAGAEGLLISLPSAAPDDVLRALDDAAAVAAQFR
jgi:probable F420-dependent oxidoreductase